MDRLSLISLLVGGVLPLLVATVTKASWPEYIKSLLLAVLSAASGAGTALSQPGAALAPALANAGITFVTAVAVAAGTWKPTGVIARLESILVKDVEPALDARGWLPGASSATQTFIAPGVAPTATTAVPVTHVFASPPVAPTDNAPDGSKG